MNAGYRRIKIKIKPGWDLEVVRQVRAAFPKILLMGDANSAYTLADIDLLSSRWTNYDVMMFEQPLHYEDMIDHAELQRQIERRSASTNRSILRTMRARRSRSARAGSSTSNSAASADIGKLAPFTMCAASNGIPVWCGGMLESGIGRAHNVALSSLENFSLPGDVSASKTLLGRGCYRPASSFSGREGSRNQRARYRVRCEGVIPRRSHGSDAGIRRMIVYEADWVCPATSPPIRNGSLAVEGNRIVVTSVRMFAARC